MRILFIASTIALMFNLSVCFGQIDTKEIQANINYNNEKAFVTFTNNGDDTIFLFSSYLDSQRSKLRYLYRINQEQDTARISFLPIIPLLYCHPSFLNSPLIYKKPENEKETLITEALYNFISIPPKETKCVFIYLQDIYNKTTYIKDEDVDITNMHINSILKIPNLIDVDCERINNYTFEFAIYNSIRDITNDNYINRPWLFNNAVKDFKILRISIMK